jgi:ketosteroid isomerase-like protein
MFFIKGVTEMKHLLIVAIVFLAASACQAAGPAFSDADGAEIEAAVSEVFQRMVDGMNEDDAEKILSAYSQDILYTGRGETFEGWDAFSQNVRDTYMDANLQVWHHRVDEIRVKALSQDYALVSAWGASGPEYQFGYSVTDLFHRTPDGWLIVNEHESDSSSPGVAGGLRSVNLFNLPESVSEADLLAGFRELNEAVRSTGYMDAGYSLLRVTQAQVEDTPSVGKDYILIGHWPDQAAYDEIHESAAYIAAGEKLQSTFDAMSESVAYSRYVQLPVGGPGEG